MSERPSSRNTRAKSKTLKTTFDCKAEIERMLKNSQTKVIMPTVTLGVLRQNVATGQTAFTDGELRLVYESAVQALKKLLGHDVHIGARYEDAYGMRMGRYGVLRSEGHLRYSLTTPFTTHAAELCSWLPDRIKQHINLRVGIIPELAESAMRLKIAEDIGAFMRLATEQIERNPTTFEIVSFALIKVHLEKFACKVYRDTRTSAHDRGVDLATNFGVVYQVKKLTVRSKVEAEKLYAELRLNFDRERLQDGNVILVIDDIAEDVRQYLIDMKVQSIKKEYLLSLASGFSDVEDRQKVLRVIYEEFRRDFSSVI